MKIDIDIENSNNTTACRFAHTCLGNFDRSLCCEIIREGDNVLIVSPVSTFKSSNCSYVEKVKVDNRAIHVCSCPVRLEIFRKHQI